MKGRRRFFAECGRAALGLPLLSLVGCSRQSSTTPAPKDAAGAGNGWDELVADLEKQLPALLAKATTVPAVSMALVTDAKLRWRGAFGVKDFGSKVPVDPDTVFEAGVRIDETFASM